MDKESKCLIEEFRDYDTSKLSELMSQLPEGWDELRDKLEELAKSIEQFQAKFARGK